MNKHQTMPDERIVFDAAHQDENNTDAMETSVITVYWKLISQYKAAMFIAIVCGVISAMLQIGPPVFASYIVAAMQAGEKDLALIYVSAMLVSGLLVALFYMSSTMVSHLIAANIQAEVRQNIGAKLKRVPLGYFTKQSGTDLKNILIDDVERMEDGIAHLIPEISAAITGPFFIAIVMFIVDWRLAVAALLPVILGYLAFILIMTGQKKLTIKFFNARENISSTMGEVVSVIPVVKIYNNGDSSLQRAQASFHSFRTLVDQWIEQSIVKSNWFLLLTSSNLLFVTPLSIILLHFDQTTLPVVVFFHLAALSLGIIVSLMFDVMNRLRQQEGVVSRYETFMSQTSLTEPLPQEIKNPTGRDIEFKNVRFGYEDVNLFNDLNLRIPEGSSLALVGPSGSGKSTIAHLLARFWDVDGGSITIGGTDIRYIGSESLYGLLSFVFQDVFLFSRSVKDNIKISKPQASDEEVRGVAKRARADEFIKALPGGYETEISPEHCFSVGQKQRLSIARALLSDAPILVLDEAMAFSDPENEYEVQQAISSLVKGKTLIVIAHRLSTIQHVDQIAFVENGRIVEQGTHPELLARHGSYAKQWQAHLSAKSFQVTKRSHE